MKEHIMGCDVFQPLFAQNGIYFSFRIKIFSNLILQIAKIFNERGRRNVINYRMRWLDKDGLMAAPYEAWSTIALEGQQETVITEVCPNNKAVDYILEMRTN